MLALGTLAVVTASAFTPKHWYTLHWTTTTFVALIALEIYSLGESNLVQSTQEKLGINGGILWSKMGSLAQFSLGAISFLALATQSPQKNQEEGGTTAQSVGLILIASILLIAAQTPTLMIAAIELQSYAIYILIALGSAQNYRAVGTGIYFLVGAVATSAIVLGWAVSYNTGEISNLLVFGDRSTGQMLLGAGLLIKVGCFPYNVWLPISYNAFSYQTLVYVGSLPQVALGFQIWEASSWELPMVFLVAGISVGLGGLLSASATQTRHIIALSSTSHMGYLLAGTAFNVTPVMVYTAAYSFAFMALCASFICYSQLRPQTRIVELRGAANTIPLQAASLQAATLSLAGIPPLLGFYAKVIVLLGGLTLENQLLFPFLLVLAGVPGLVAYLRVIITTVGYPQTLSYSIFPLVHSSGGVQALLMGLIALVEILSGNLYIFALT